MSQANLADGFAKAKSVLPQTRKSVSGKAETSAIPKAEPSAKPVGITKYTLMMPNDLVNEFEELYEKLRAAARVKHQAKLKKNEFTRQVLVLGLDERKLRDALNVAA